MKIRLHTFINELNTVTDLYQINQNYCLWFPKDCMQHGYSQLYDIEKISIIFNFCDMDLCF